MTAPIPRTYRLPSQSQTATLISSFRCRLLRLICDSSQDGHRQFLGLITEKQTNQWRQNIADNTSAGNRAFSHIRRKLPICTIFRRFPPLTLFPFIYPIPNFGATVTGGHLHEPHLHTAKIFSISIKLAPTASCTISGSTFFAGRFLQAIGTLWHHNDYWQQMRLIASFHAQPHYDLRHL